ncbi:hypothetical protein PIB30_081643 [Stylosanthes scabra]|uniref:Uncharacterized protein n=1 Tax=Stylosanthes scabra TaxID=79078 RepID=A0ABU6UVH4_9FABA|nr:hypothetical protein [Stylosanthes scabra]
MCLVAPRLSRPAGSPSSSVSYGPSGSFHRERERSPRTPLPPPAPMPVPGPMHPVSRTPMMDARRYRSLFPRRRVAPHTPPSPPTPPPSDDEPSDYEGDADADEIGDPEEPYAVSDSSLSSRDVSSAGASYGSERESASLSSSHSGHFSSDSSSGSGFVRYGSVTSGSASDASSDDDLDDTWRPCRANKETSLTTNLAKKDKDRHSFSPQILAKELPKKFRCPTEMEPYDGITDPQHHLDAFWNRIVLVNASDAIQCKAFPSLSKSLR